jgi:hypothetical protein
MRKALRYPIISLLLSNSVWISQVSFAAVPGTPILLEPTATITATKPIYKWKPVSGSTTYKLVISSPSAVLFTKTYTPAQLQCPTQTAICQIMPDKALGIGNYVWKVNAANASGSGLQATKTFRRGTPLAPVLVAPATDITQTSPSYNWKASGTAEQYNLNIRNSAGVNLLDKWYTATQLGCSSGVQNCTIKPPLVLKFAANQWRVRAKNVLGIGGWSPYKSFKNANMCNVVLVPDETSGGCHVRLAEPANCEEIDLSQGKEYLLGWTSDGTYCETPWTFYIAGNPANLATGENIYWKQFSTNTVAGISHTGGLVRLSAASLDSLGLTSDNGIYHWLVVSWYGSHPASRTFRIKR